MTLELLVWGAPLSTAPVTQPPVAVPALSAGETDQILAVGDGNQVFGISSDATDTLAVNTVAAGETDQILAVGDGNQTMEV